MIVLSLGFVLWRVRKMLPDRSPCGIVNSLFHILLASEAFMLVIGGASFLGAIRGGGGLQTFIVSALLLIILLWILGAIIYAMICITKELYLDQPGDGTIPKDS